MNLHFRHCFSLWVIKKLYCKPYCLNKFVLVTARGYWSFEIAYNSKAKRKLQEETKTLPWCRKKSNSAKSTQVDNNYWNSWKIHFSSKPIEFWNSFMNMIPKGHTALFWMKRQSDCTKQASNCSNYNVSVSAGPIDNTVIIFYLYTIQVTTLLSWFFLHGLW